MPSREEGVRAVIVVRIANAGTLRRQFGRAWAERLADRLLPILVPLVRPVRVVTSAFDRIEFDVADINRSDLDGIVDTLLALAADPVVIDNDRVPLRLAIGAALANGPCADELALVEEAQEACAQADRGGKPVVRPVGDAPVTQRSDLSDDLKLAINLDELRLLYQPKVHLRHRRVAGLEALIRWDHPVRGLVMPGDFIPLAEQTGEIAALTLWVLRQVIADQRRLIGLGHELPVYVNVAGVLLTDEAFIEQSSALVAGGGVPIGFEITETSVIRDPATAIANLNRFAAMTIPIAIDDYGSGLSSLAYLKQLPACELKIDKLFVTQLTSSHRDPLIVRSTIDLAHALEMEVVAEGIESANALALLSVMGCDLGQGFFIKRPGDLASTVAFLDRHRDGWTDGGASTPYPGLRAAQRG